MHYIVEVNDTELTVSLEEAARGQWTATVENGADDSPELDLKLLGQDNDGAYVVRINGETRRFQLDEDYPNYFLTDDRDMVNVSVDEAGEVVLEAGDTGERRGDLDLGTIESPITGVTLDIFVETGQHVDKGEELVVVEAMKMENTLTATVAGTVDDIFVDEGDTVFTDDPLLHIEPDDE